MVHVIVIHKVADFSKWKKIYDADLETRKQGGSKGGRMFRSMDDPNNIVLMFEWDSLENAAKFGQSDDLKQKMMEAGVVGMPQMYLLEEVEKTQA